MPSGQVKVLVTGATGFIGKHLVRQLATDGHQVTILARNKDALKDFKEFDIELIQGDILDNFTVMKACENRDIVYHLAGVIAYRKSERELMEKVNIKGTRKIIDACITHSVDKFVYLSSVVAIGASFDGTPLTEESPYNIAHLDLGYFQTKHQAEKIVIDAYKEHGLKTYILNPSTIYGAGDALKGSRKTQVKVAKGKFPFYTPGGVNVVSIKDVLYCLKVITEKGKPGERYIVAGENITIKQLFEMIAKAGGVEPPKIGLPRPAIKVLGLVGDILGGFGIKGPMSGETAWTSTLYHWFSSKKAQRELGLKPTPAKEAINESVNWMKKSGYLE